MTEADWAEEERTRLSRECGCIHSSEPIALALRKAKAEGYTLGFNETAALILGEIAKAQNGGAVPDKDELALKVATRILEIEAGK